jgi:hypothetical protein
LQSQDLPALSNSPHPVENLERSANSPTVRTGLVEDFRLQLLPSAMEALLIQQAVVAS